MKLSRLLFLTLACAATIQPRPAYGQAGLSATPDVPLTSPAAGSSPSIASLRVRDGQLSAAVEELSNTLEKSRLPAINVIFTPEARMIQVPELLLRNVTGPDALRLIAASAGCELEVIPGNDSQVIGYRIYPASGGAGIMAPGIPGGGYGAPAPVSPPPVAPIAPIGAPAPPPPPLVAEPRVAPPTIMGFGAAGMASPSSVRVYSLGGITNTTKFDDVEATLEDVLRADGVSADAAKLAFHQKTNVLVVNGDFRVQELVGQFLEALQKNVAAAAAEDARSGNARHELVEAKVRMQAEIDHRARLSKELEQTEAMLREAQRELDRLRQTTAKPH